MEMVDMSKQRMVSPVEAIKRFFTNGFSMRGRASRSEFWWVTLTGWFIVCPAMVVALFIIPFGTFVSLYLMFALVCIIPCFTLTVRRFHDCNMSGAFILLGLIPTIGGILVLIMELRSSHPYKNQWGDVPNLVE